MKKFTFLAASLFVFGSVNAQIFTDNFDSYTLGALGPQSPQWTTWSGTEGGTEDGIVSSAQAQSGTNSAYFNSTVAAGGPQDCILSFGQQYTSGIFTFETGMFIPTGKGAYFNFQANTTPGQVWALNFTASAGSFTFDDGITANLLTASYPVNDWFTLRIEANLTLGVWEGFVDGVSVGTWANGINNVATADFYPQNASSQYYIDDVMFDHETYTLPNLNGIASSVSLNGNIASQTVSPTGVMMNGGTTPITAFEAVLSYNGNNYTKSVTGVNIASLASYTVVFDDLVLVPGANVVTLTINNINGGPDEDLTDNVTSINSNPVVPAPGKMVVGEEATGTWCQWCPRGAVYMDKFEQDFEGFWAGIAVHNGDPMTVTEYDAGIGTLIGGYPSALVDRGPDVDPSAMYNDFYARLQLAPVALMSTTQTFDAVTRVLTVEVSADFQSAATSAYKLACVLTEDNVTGSGAGWNQSNAYAGGNNGVMGGYESLPSSVPAAQMVYDHVARAIAPSFAGDATSFPAVVNAGETHSKTYTFTLPATWEVGEMNVIGMIIDPTGKINNASKFSLEDNVGINDLESNATSFTIFPNPATMHATVGLELAKESEIEISIIDLSGKVVTSRNYGKMNGNMAIDLNTSLLNAGVYMVNVSIDNVSKIQRLVIQ